MKPQDMQDLKVLVEFLKQHQVAEFDLDRGDLKIRLKFGPPDAPATNMSDLARLLANAQAAPATPPPSASAASLLSAEAPVEEPSEDTATGLHTVKSPIVGTFYGSPSPGSGAFVSPATTSKRAR